jgi:DegV family protein with EDD domain
LTLPIYDTKILLFCPKYSMPSPEYVHIVTDSGCSMRPEHEWFQPYKEIISIASLGVNFLNRKQPESIDDLELLPEDFYARIAACRIPPKTSGSVLKSAIPVYEYLAKEGIQTISIHTSEKESGVYNSARVARDQVLEKYPNWQTELIDSQTTSGALWLLDRYIADLSKRKVKFDDLYKETLARIPTVQVLTVLSTLDYLKYNGRAEIVLQALVGDVFHLKPLIGFENGKIVTLEKDRTLVRLRQRMVDRVGANGKLADLIVLHTNVPQLAQQIRDMLIPLIPQNKYSEMFPNGIPIIDAAPAIAVNAGVGAVGVGYRTDL